MSDKEDEFNDLQQLIKQERDKAAFEAVEKYKQRKAGKLKGAKPKVIDWKIAARLCHLNNTQEDIANILGVHRDTLRLKCKKELGMSLGDFYNEELSVFKSSLREQQATSARLGSVQMQIHLGKNYLGQNAVVNVSNNNPELPELTPAEILAISKEADDELD